ncbi:MAG: glycosyltransferase [Candidatus Omnitrophica bacterium]|nr:glycosyltransferase [Candidatus Omnitrophota bacterium]
MSRPLVSVLMATYNRAAFLPQAIESVLAQTYPHWELVIINDGSTDNTRQIVESFQARDARIRYVYQANQGLAASRHHGVRLCRGKYIAFLDDDDLYLPDKLEQQVAFLEAHPEIGLVYSPVQLVDREKRVLGMYPQQPARTFLELIDGCTIATHGVLVRTACFHQVGTFRKDRSPAEDYDMWLRISQSYAIAFLPECVGLYRKHETCMTQDVFSAYAAYRRIYATLLKTGRLSQEARQRVSRALTRTVRVLAVCHYQRAAGSLESCRYSEAARSYSAAIRFAPLVGLHVPWGGSRHLLYRIVRPYAAWLYCGWRALTATRTRRRIAYYLVTGGFGGVEMYLLAMLRRLDRARFDPIVYFSCSDLEADRRIRGELERLKVPIQPVSPEGVPLSQTLGNGGSSASHALPARSRVLRSSRVKQILLARVPQGVRAAWYHAKHVRRTAEYLRRDAIDIVHVLHGHYPSLEAPLIAGRLAGIPVRIADVRLRPDSIHGLPFVRKGLVRLAATSATAVYAMSQRMANELVTQCRVARNRIHVVRLAGIDLAPFMDPSLPPLTKAQLGLPPRCTVVVVPARFMPQKGHGILLDAIAALQAKHPEVRYLFLGDGPLQGDIERSITAKRLNSQIHFLGFRDDMPRLLKAADLVVIPSLFEGGPYVLLEAMAAGKPVVTTDVGFTREVFVDSQMGRIVTSNRSAELASAMDQLLAAEPAMLRGMGAAAQRQIQLLWSQEATSCAVPNGSPHNGRNT